MINDKAYVPSDILTASNGLTIEVMNTDAVWKYGANRNETFVGDIFLTVRYAICRHRKDA